jgi:hypothetical protein
MVPQVSRRYDSHTGDAAEGGGGVAGRHPGLRWQPRIGRTSGRSDVTLRGSNSLSRRMQLAYSTGKQKARAGHGAALPVALWFPDAEHGVAGSEDFEVLDRGFTAQREVPARRGRE